MPPSPALAELLAATEIGAQVSATTRERLALGSHRVDASKGRFLIDAGQNAAPMHFIISGAVQLAVPNISGNEKTIATLDDGKAFGIAEAMAERGFHYYARTQARSILVTVSAATLLNAAADDPALTRATLGALGRHFYALVEDIARSNRYNAHQRVVHLLLSRARINAAGVLEARLPYSKTVTASRLGLAPETFSRSLATLTDQGLITVHHRVIVIHDRSRMRTLLATD